MAYRRSSHSVYDIEYHIVFCIKCRYRALYSNIAERRIGVITEVRSANYVGIMSGNVSPAHFYTYADLGISASLSIKGNAI
ncbi:MAG: transposase [Alphaproteobacteria bacterium]|nr:transposase [Alphaproteobacteria bacterium]